MPGRTRTRRIIEFPLAHSFKLQWGMSADGGVNATMYPVLHQDEARTPGTYFTNPEHASFAEYASGNCSPDSEVLSVFTTLRFSLTKGALHTDNVDALRFAFMTTHTAFEDQLVKDNRTVAEIQDLLELTSEATDRQATPLYNGVDMPEKYTNSSLLHADMPGLTATQKLEGVSFQSDLYYDHINYSPIADKLRSVQDGLRWITLTRQNPTRSILIRQKPNTKRMNPFTQLSVIIYLPQGDTDEQIPTLADMTAIPHLYIDAKTRFLEWNTMFHVERA